jgi:hypothetical protein
MPTNLRALVSDHLSEPARRANEHIKRLVTRTISRTDDHPDPDTVVFGILGPVGGDVDIEAAN